MATNRDAVLELVSSSPVAAARKERDVWLELFDKRGWIEDPAGSIRYSAADRNYRLGVFYDIFIAHSEIDFVPETDYVCGLSVVRDGLITMRINGGCCLRIPVFLRYEVSRSGKIGGLRAHWKPSPVMIQAFKYRPGGMKYLAESGRRLLEATGLRGFGGFAMSVFNTAVGARLTIFKLKEYLATGRYSEAEALFSFVDGKELVIFSDQIEVFSPGYLTLGELKLLSLDKLIENRNCVSLRCEVMLSGSKYSGVAFFSFALAGFRIRKLEIFLSDDTELPAE